MLNINILACVEELGIILDDTDSPNYDADIAKI